MKKKTGITIIMLVVLVARHRLSRVRRIRPERIHPSDRDDRLPQAGHHELRVGAGHHHGSQRRAESGRAQELPHRHAGLAGGRGEHRGGQPGWCTWRKQAESQDYDAFFAYAQAQDRHPHRGRLPGAGEGPGHLRPHAGPDAQGVGDEPSWGWTTRGMRSWPPTPRSCPCSRRGCPTCWRAAW